MFHDVCWPHARRDTYEPDRIPEDQRQPLVQTRASPRDQGHRRMGPAFVWGRRRGRRGEERHDDRDRGLTAERPGIQLAVVPAFFGFGVMWHRDAPQASAGRARDRPMTATRSSNGWKATGSSTWSPAGAGPANWSSWKKVAKQEDLLRRLLGSSAFTALKALRAEAARQAALHPRGSPSRCSTMSICRAELSVSGTGAAVFAHGPADGSAPVGRPITRSTTSVAGPDDPTVDRRRLAGRLELRGQTAAISAAKVGSHAPALP